MPVVYFNPKTVAHKKLPELSPGQVSDAFENENLEVYTDAERLMSDLRSMDWSNSNLLIMTSGNFDGQDLYSLAKEIIPVNEI